MKTLSEELKTQEQENTSKINYQAGHLTARPLTQQDNKSLGPILKDPAVKSYGDGSHGTEESESRKLNLWGPRGTNQGFFRCWLFDDLNIGYNESAGFINIGRTTVQYEGKPTIELGILFKIGSSLQDQNDAARFIKDYIKNPIKYCQPENIAGINMAEVKKHKAVFVSVSKPSEDTDQVLRNTDEALKSTGFSCSKDFTITGVNRDREANTLTFNYIDKEGQQHVSNLTVPGDRFSITDEYEILEKFDSDDLVKYIPKNLYVLPLGEVETTGVVENTYSF